MFGFFRRRRRRALRAAPVPPTWAAILRRNAPFVARLSDGARAKLFGDMQVLLAEKHFIAAGGMTIDDEVRVTIVAAAARLVLNLDVDRYDAITELVVYPRAYQHPGRDGAVLGEAHGRVGVVVLAWDPVRRGLRDERDGADTATHEFAHVLDAHDGLFDGTPALHARADYLPWACGPMGISGPAAVDRTMSNRRFTLSRSLTALALVLLAAAGCGKSSPSGAGKQAGTGAPATATPPAADPARAESAKLEAAIECLNNNSGRVFEVRDGYLGDVDPATGVPLPNRPMNLMGLGTSEPCERKVKAAAALTPAVPELDKASADYVTALIAFRAAWDELDAYYKKGEHKDDQGAKAKLLHPKVMTAVDAFAGAHDTLQAVVKLRNRQRHQAALAQTEKRDGRTLEVILGTLMLEASALLDLVDARQPDAPQLAAQLATYGKLVDEADAYAAAHPDEAAKWGSLTNVRNYSKGFLAASKVINRKLTEPTPATASEHEDVVNQYNYLVDNYNRH